ncbi:MAG: MlaD family protein [Acidovorax sp.]
MENKSHALAAGIFVIAVTALLVALGLFLTRDRTHYNRYELSSKESVSGLQPQAAVRYKGVSVGKVTDIGFDTVVPGNVLIRIAVNTEAPITPATFATLGYQGVTGLAHILLDDSPTPLPASPSGPDGLPRLPLKTSPVAQLAEQGPLILAQVQQATERVNRVLSDDNQKLFATALAQIGNAAGQLQQLGQQLQPTVAALPGTMQALQKAGNSASAAAQQVGQTAQRLNAPGGAIEQITQGTQALSRAADNLGGNTLPRMNDAADDVARAARQMSRVAGRVGDNPQSLIYGTGTPLPGPGEPGFTAPVTVPAP